MRTTGKGLPACLMCAVCYVLCAVCYVLSTDGLIYIYILIETHYLYIPFSEYPLTHSLSMPTFSSCVSQVSQGGQQRVLARGGVSLAGQVAGAGGDGGPPFIIGGEGRGGERGYSRERREENWQRRALVMVMHALVGSALP